MQEGFINHISPFTPKVVPPPAMPDSTGWEDDEDEDEYEDYGWTGEFYIDDEDED